MAEIPEGASVSRLERVPLGAALQTALDRIAREAAGHPVWRNRKIAEARDLLALFRLAPHRGRVLYLNVREALLAKVALAVPVSVRKPGEETVSIVRGAELGIVYPQHALLTPQPGFAFINIRRPSDVFHPQVGPDPSQPVCLGARIPAGMRLSEMVLTAYSTLALQAITMDELDPAGVMDPVAARWWQQNVARIPLSRTPFLQQEGES